MNPSRLTANLSVPVSRFEKIREYCRDRVVLDIGCVQHRSDNADNADWLHRNIVDVASRVVGVDYLEDDVQALKDRGFNVVAQDVCQPFDLGERFDVIVVGNLIEHLSSFEGLLMNLEKHLKKGGVILISTANPFYKEQYFYSAFKNGIAVNAEHTCWLDPVTMDQLVVRFNLVTEAVWWIRERWKLPRLIMNGGVREFNMFSGHWDFIKPPSFTERLLAPPLLALFRLLASKQKYQSAIDVYGDNIGRVAYLGAVSALFGVFWSVYGALIVTAPINRYELFLSVLRRQDETI